MNYIDCIYWLNLGVILGVGATLLCSMLNAVRKEFQAKHPPERCNCSDYVFTGEWFCNIHGKMLSMPDRRDTKRILPDDPIIR